MEKNLLVGAKDDGYVPKISFGRIIFDRLKNRHPKDIININAHSKEVLLCEELLEDSVKLATILQQHGLRKGDVISILNRTTVSYFVPVLAAFYLGVAVNPINPDFTKDELLHCLRLSKPKLVFCCKSALPTLLEIKNQLENIPVVLTLGPITELNLKITNVDDLVKRKFVEINSFKPCKLDCNEDVAFIAFSSGTTGFPKGVMLTHENLRCPINFLSNPKFGNVSQSDTTIIITPMYQIFGPVIQLLALFASMKTILMDTFEPSLFLKCIDQYRVSKLYLVSPVVSFLAKTPMVDNYDLSSITDIYVGASPLSKELQDEATGKLRKVAIRQIYGLTETCGPCTFQANVAKSGTVGIPMPGVIAKVWNDQTKKNLGPQQVGEICFKGAMLMKRYIPNIDYLDKDGFFHSGDLGFYDSDSYLHIIDRVKDLIKYKSFQVAPAELEALILTHPHVRECAVIGVPNEAAGEVPLAYIALKDDARVREEEIFNYVAERISPPKHLHGGVVFVNEIPKSPAGKILRRQLREMHKA